MSDIMAAIGLGQLATIEAVTERRRALAQRYFTRFGDGFLQRQRAAAAPVWMQFLRFAMVGAPGTAMHYPVLWFGVERCGVGAAAASGAGYALGSLVNYALNYFLTALMWLLVHQAGWYYWPAQVLATGLGLLSNFAGSRWWAFRPPPASSPARPTGEP